MKPIYKLLISLTLIALTSCGTPTHRKDAQSDEGIVTLRNLDFKDYQIAAEDLITKLLSSDALTPVSPNKPAVIMVSRIKNSTAEHLDTQLLTQKMTIAIRQSGRAQTTTKLHSDGTLDPASAQVRNLEDEDAYDPSTLQKGRTLQAPRYSLAGEITELYRQKGRKRESYYQIYLTLTDLKTGLAVWEDAKEILKQEKKPLIGF